MPPPLTTYQVTDHRAAVWDRPMGRRVRNMIRDELFQGRPAPGRPDWIMRTEDGMTPRGYIKASLCSPLDLAALTWTAEDLPAPLAVRPDRMGDVTDALAEVLARGRTHQRARLVRAVFGDFAAEVIGRAASQAAGAVVWLVERQARLEAENVVLAARIAALEGTRERAVGEGV